MKKLLILLSIFFSFNCVSQTLTWSQKVVSPKETTSSVIFFPGVDGSNYYITEWAGTGKKRKNYITSVDKQSLEPIKEVALEVFFDRDGKEYSRGSNFFFRNKRYSFFLDKAQTEIFDVYSCIQDLDGGDAGEIEPFQKLNAEKVKAMTSSNKESKDRTLYYASDMVIVKPAYDSNSILSAIISDNIDKDNSIVTITEWNKDLEAMASGKYKIPFVPNSSFSRRAGVRDIVKDNNGFCYILLCSVDPADKEIESNYWVYQFKLSDPSYSKVFKKELGTNMSTLQASFFQDKSGKLYVSNIGLEIERKSDKEDYYRVNTAVIASFGKNGVFQPVYSGRLSNEMMYNFVSEKLVERKGYVNSLRIINVLPTAEGGTYVTWQHEWTEIGNHANVYHYDNVLVQYYNGKKMLWEKPVYKQQANRETAEDIYASVAVFLVNDNLCLVYPDDPKNADKAIDDKDVSSFSVVKFGNRDLAGIFVATITPKGNYTRKYLKWPEDRIGYGICIPSLINIGNNEIIGTARRLRQGSLILTAEGYTFFKIKF